MRQIRYRFTAISKWRGELAIQDAHPNALIVRTNVVYGPDPARRNFVYQCCRAWRQRQPMRVPNDQISSPTYNNDLARAAVNLVQSGAAGLFHVGGPQSLSRLEFALAIARSLQVDESLIIGIPTSALAQKAKRPLRGGLLSDKLGHLLPDMHMRCVEEAFVAWKEIEIRD